MAMPFPVEEIPVWVCSWLRSIAPKDSSGPAKIFLSRRGVGGRQLANELELQTALEKIGFISIQPQTLSVAEQARMMSAARCVVAPHGAALTNMVFSPPGALLLELFHPQHKNACYLNLAAACGHRYASLEGMATEKSRPGHLEYTVDVSSTLSELEKLLSK